MKAPKYHQKPWLSNHPLCPNCGAFSRPNVLMFNDSDWIHNTKAEKRYLEWKRKVRDELEENPETRLVILEIGCGITIPSVRTNDELTLSSMPEGQATLIRVNPDYPKLDNSKGRAYVSIMGKGLDTIKAIDEKLKL